MTKPKGESLDEVFAELNRDPEFQKAERAIKPRFDIVRQVLMRRVDLGLSQLELAEKAKTHQSRISKIESAEYDIRLSTLVSIAEALECEVHIQLIPFGDGESGLIEFPISFTSTSHFTTTVATN